MKKLLGILLLFCLFLPLCGGLAILYYQKSIIRKTVKNQVITKIDSSRLTFLKFSLQEKEAILFWEDEGEFQFQGEMYDVVYTKIEKDSVWYWCWKDSEETILNQKINQLLLGALSQDHTTQNTQKWLADFWKYVFIYPKNEPLRKLEGEWKLRRFIFYSISSSFPFIHKLTPPPQFI